MLQEAGSISWTSIPLLSTFRQEIEGIFFFEIHSAMLKLTLEQAQRRHALWVQEQLPLAGADVASALQAIRQAEKAAPTTPGGKIGD